MTNTSFSLSEDSQNTTSNETFFALQITFRMGLNPFVALGGIVANVINALVFRRMGLSDGVTPTFLFLSVSDCFYCIVTLAKATCEILQFLAESYHVRCLATAVNVILLKISVMSDDVSRSCTMVISGARCCSVAAPLRVKTLFTTRRQIVAVITLSLPLIMAITSTLIIVSPHTVYGTEAELKTSCVVYDPKQSIQRPVYLLQNIFNITSLVVVFACLIILIVHLKRSSEVHRQMTSNTESERAATRDRQVIKMSVLVAAIFFLTNLPIIVMFVLRVAFPEFNRVGKFQNLFTLSLNIAELLLVLNASVNIIIYLHSNSRYYAAHKLLCRRSSASN